jgi:hypothetical protein
MIKFIEVLEDINLDNLNNCISILRKGRYELMNSNSTICGYDFELIGNSIKIGIYLAGQEHQEFTTCVTMPNVYWNKFVKEYIPKFKSIEDQLEYDFHSSLNPVFKN